MKDKILNEIRNSAKSKFYKTCLENDCAFDVVVDGTKYEVRPCRASGYWSGGEAYTRGMYESEMPQFTAKELFDIINN